MVRLVQLGSGGVVFVQRLNILQSQGAVLAGLGRGGSQSVV